MAEWNPEKDEKIQRAIQRYLSEHNSVLSDDVKYEAGIDFVSVEIDGKSVLIVCLSPMSDYKVRKTEYTDKYLRANKERKTA
jgi:hypothetical protein